MTDDDTLTCCPDCRAADIRVHSASTINHDGRPPRYKCHECGFRFDEPAERCRQATTAGSSKRASRSWHLYRGGRPSWLMVEAE
jgi:transposase-like protein